MDPGGQIGWPEQMRFLDPDPVLVPGLALGLKYYFNWNYLFVGLDWVGIILETRTSKLHPQ